MRKFFFVFLLVLAPSMVFGLGEVTKKQLETKAPWVNLSEFSTLTAAKNYAVTKNKALHISKVVNITVNTDLSTVPEIDVLRGGSFNISPGVTLTLPANFRGGKNTLFTGDGLPLFNTKVLILPEWLNCSTSNSVTVNSAALIKIINSAKINGNTVIFGAGTYLLNTSVPIRQDESIPVISSIVSYNNIHIKGVGKNTVLKTNNAVYGADVFQFRGVSDIEISDLSVAAAIPGGAEDGSNGFSFTDGSRNITLRNINAGVLPYTHIPAGSMNGGAAYSIQDNHASFGTHNIRFIECSGDGGSYGFHYNGSGAAAKGVDPASGIVFIGGTLKNYYQGIGIETAKAGATEAPLSKQSISVMLTEIIDCQRTLFMGGSTNVHVVGVRGHSSLTAAIDPATGAAWLNTDTVLRGIFSLSMFKSSIMASQFYIASCVNYIYIGGGYSGVTAASIDCVYKNNIYSGVATGAGYGVDTTYGGLIGCEVGPDTMTGAADNAFKIIDGSFTSSTGWTLGTGWSVSAGAIATGVVSNQAIFKNINLTKDQKYLISVNVSGYSGTGKGGFYIYAESGGDNQINTTQFTGNNFYTRVITPLETGSYRIGFSGSDTYNATHKNLDISLLH